MRVSNRRVWWFGTLLAIAIFLVPRGFTQQSSPLAVVPGAPGFGMQTRAAYGGPQAPTVYRVTTLNDKGSGSLRAALEASGPRVVIFEVSGTISLNDDLHIDSPYLTVAGQTAPSPGITVRNYGLVINTNDVLLQHFRVRPGGATCNNSIQAWGTAAYNIVLDHMSVSWGQDENVVVYNLARPINVTVWRSIIAEGLEGAGNGMTCAGSPDGTFRSHGLLIYASTRNVFVGQTLFANNVERNPYMLNGTSSVLVNNLVYNWYGVWGFAYGNHPDVSGEEWYGSAVGNRFIGGPDTTDGNDGHMFSFLAYYDQPGNRIYRRDNTLATDGSETGTIDNEYTTLSYNPSVDSPPSQAPLPDGFQPLASTAVEAFVLANAGARPGDRDAVDSRIVNEVRTRRGTSFIGRESMVGGWPTLAANRRPLTLPTNPHDVTSSRYTTLEKWLQNYAALAEGATTSTFSR
jgi:hypothetical protein